MTKQSDKIIVLETKLDGLIVSVGELKRTLTEYIKEAQKGRIDCNVIQSRTSTMTNIQWYFIAVIIVGLIGLGIKSL